MPTRRILLGSALAGFAPGVARAAPSVILDDASRLNPTPVARHVVVRQTDEADTIARLRVELREAASSGRPVAIGAARHSMGGQSLARGGLAFTFEAGRVEPDAASASYRAGAGSRWHGVIAALDRLGFSPAVMQSNNDFAVASTFSVNAHGWAVPRAPFGSTVRALRLMLADGAIVVCSRTENAELFRHAMGGYGLFGIILDLDVAMVPNLMLLPRFEVLPAEQFAARFLAVCGEKGVNLAYGRLDVSPRWFLDQALLVSFRPAPPDGRPLPPPRIGGPIATLAREIYRAEIGSDVAKQFRWFAETTIGPRIAAGPVTRNALLDEPVAALAGHDAGRTDILHEYFLPPERLVGFLAACREVILPSQQELLNVTLRFVAADTDSLLAYAPAPRISAVMSFSQLRNAQAEADMQRMTRALVERVLALGGSFYLPYRLHARRDQVARAYPALEAFVAGKRRYDPGLLFRNTLWDAWIA